MNIIIGSILMVLMIIPMTVVIICTKEIGKVIEEL
jgi:hypothetical protein